VRSLLGGNPNPLVTQVASLVQQRYAGVRAQKAFDRIVFPAIGADFQRYALVGMQLPTYLEKQPGVFQQMMMFCQQYNLGAEFLIAGLDATGAHLIHVSNPGVTAQLEKLGHASIGSGGLHAMMRLSLTGQSTQRGLLETLAEVYSAKRVSEVAPGVGNATDIAVVDLNGTWPCPRPVVEELERIHKEGPGAPAKLTKLKELYDELRK
jgi:hypothetical protein